MPQAHTICLYTGAKRLQALSTLVVAVIILPWALWQLSTQVVIDHLCFIIFNAFSLESSIITTHTCTYNHHTGVN